MACGKTLILPTIANHQSRPECEEILRQTETLGQEVVNEVEASIERKAVHSVDGRRGTEGALHTTTGGRRRAGEGGERRKGGWEGVSRGQEMWGLVGMREKGTKRGKGCSVERRERTISGD